MSASSSKIRLNFVSDDQAACVLHRRNSAGNETGWIDPHAIAGKNAVDE
jgi:hypothetical protein